MLSEGDKAPSFELQADAGAGAGKGGRAGEQPFSLKEALKEGDLVLYFYPKDNTPGCTREAQAFAEASRKLSAAGARVAGVSKDSIKSHCGFREKYALNFPLLSDPDLAVHKAYGAYGEKTMYGKKVLGTIRSTFLIGRDGTVVRAWRGVKVDGHVDAVLAALTGEGDTAKKASAKKTSAKKKTTTAKKAK
jgi:peroxiredoxin Q/BCP